MKKTGWKWATLASLVAVFVMFALVLAAPAAAQETKAKAEPTKAKAAAKNEVVKEKAKDGKAGGADPNVKSTSDKNDPNAKVEPPPTKGGKGGRGFGAGWCNVSASNYTGLYVKIFVDGSYRGTVGAFDTGTVTVGTGATTFYARADFQDGSYKYWGSYVFNCAYAHNVSWDLSY